MEYDIKPIVKRLNMYKMKQGENGEHYYNKMQKWFLDDMTKIGGYANCFYYDKEDNINIDIRGGDLKESICMVILTFSSDWNGKWLNTRVITKYRKRGSPKLTASQLMKKRTTEINEMIDDFIKNATELGYLID